MGGETEGRGGEGERWKRKGTERSNETFTVHTMHKNGRGVGVSDKKERKENFMTHQLKKLHFKSIK